MGRTSLLAVTILSALAVSLTLPQFQDTYNVSQPATISPVLPSAENTTTIYSNTSLGKILKIDCNQVRYGRNLKAASCRNVFDFIPKDNTQTVFAERGAVQPHDMNLPYRMTSSDARCYVQPLLAEGAVTGQASPLEVRNAADSVFQHCVLNRGMGGIAEEIGGDNNLNVKMASYKPDIRCATDSSPSWSSCLELFENMPADKNRHMFGHIPKTVRQTRLPLTYESPDRRCVVTVDIKGAPTAVTWYEVWEGVVAVGSACVRGKGKGGKGSGLGVGRNVFVRLGDGGGILTVGNGSVEVLGSEE